MEKIRISNDNLEYDILIGKNIIESINEYIKDYKNIVCIVDKNVYELHKKRLQFIKNIYLYDALEKNKSLKELENILSFLFEKKLDRSSLIIAVGGGITGDISGFAASIYMRGIDYVNVPTTLLSQVDSSVGGKTGVNFRNTKNILGSFYHPKLVLIDINFLKTLSTKEIISGYGEILKYGFIKDDKLVYKVISKINKNNKIHDDFINIIYDSLLIKKDIVEKDEKESNLRKILNFGHTIGHGIEMLIDRDYSHGESVLLGMYYEAYISKNMKKINNEDFLFIINSIKKIIDIPHLKKQEIKKVIEKLSSDKKNEGGEINIILPISKSKVELFKNIKINIIKKVLGEKDED